jgi:hypothetical protein
MNVACRLHNIVAYVHHLPYTQLPWFCCADYLKTPPLTTVPELWPNLDWSHESNQHMINNARMAMACFKQCSCLCRCS